MEAQQISQLIQDLSADGERREQGRSRLKQLGEAAVPSLLAVVAAREGRQAALAAEILGEQMTPVIADALVAALPSHNLLLAGAALKALLHYEAADFDLLPHLLTSLPKVSIITQQSLLIALQILNDCRAVPVLVTFLNTVESPSLRTSVIKVLCHLGNPAALEAIRIFADDPDHHVRDWVVEAVHRLGSV